MDKLIIEIIASENNLHVRDEESDEGWRHIIKHRIVDFDSGDKLAFRTAQNVFRGGEFVESVLV